MLGILACLKWLEMNNYWEMLTSALKVLIKNINIEIMHWKLVKSGMFNFMKVKKSLFLMKIFY